MFIFNQNFFVLLFDRILVFSALLLWVLTTQHPIFFTFLVLCFMLLSIFIFIIIFIKVFCSYKFVCFLRNKQIINNLGTIRSFLSLSPNSLNKLSMLSWFVEQSKEEMLFLKIYLLTEFVLIVVAILGFLLLFVVFKKDTFFVNKVIPYFKKLSLIRQFVFGWFTLFYAIPNKFWVNIKLHFIFVFIISVLIYLLGLIFPFLFFCYAMYMILCFESLIFALLYKYSTFFKKSINYLLFENFTESFAENYFEWFWGNIWENSIKKITAIVTGTALVDTRRKFENTKKNQYADKQTTEREETYKQEKFKNPEERAIYHKECREEWVEKNGIVTKILKKIENWWTDVF